jgi:hypothetical protein
VEPVELGDSPQRGLLQNRLGDTGSVYASSQAQSGRGAASTQFGHRSALGLQPPHVSVADEPTGTRPGEHDGVDAGIAVGAVHQIVELTGEVDAEQAVRAAVDPGDEDGSAVLDLEMAAHRDVLPVV